MNIKLKVYNDQLLSTCYYCLNLYGFCEKYNKIEFIFNDSLNIEGEFIADINQRKGHYALDIGDNIITEINKNDYVQVKFYNSENCYITLIKNIFNSVKNNDTLFFSGDFVESNLIFYFRYMKSERSEDGQIIESKPPYILYVPFLECDLKKKDFEKQILDRSCTFCVFGTFAD